MQLAQSTIGFIGAGNIASAFMGGILRAYPDLAARIHISNPSAAKLDALKERYPALHTTSDNKDVARVADILFLTVKPKFYPAVIEEIREHVNPDTIIISVAAGLKIAFVQSLFQKDVKILRCMPNTPTMLGLGMSGLCPNSFLTEEDLTLLKELFSSFGTYEVVAEELFDTVTGVSGSGPAFIHAMAKAAEKDGMPYDQAIVFAAQTAKGAAEMVLSSGTDPETLTDNVCSPGGTTIEAVDVFKKDGLYDLVYKAQHACVEKSKKLSQ